MSESFVELTGAGDALDIPRTFGCYETDDVIGSGSYAVLVSLTNIRTRVKFAGKVMKRPKSGSIEMSALELEIRHGQSLSNEFLVSFIEVVWLENVVVCVMELVKGRNLLSLVLDDHKTVTCNWRSLFRQICLGVEYLHTKGLAHVDLKPENVLVDDALNVKLCDYGLMVECGESEKIVPKSGTLIYMSPEMVRGNVYDAKAGDIWALGIVLYVMVTGCVPWMSNNQYMLSNEIQEGVKDFDGVNAQQREIIRRCCAVNAEGRVAISAVTAMVSVPVANSVQTRARVVDVKVKGRRYRQSVYRVALQPNMFSMCSSKKRIPVSRFPTTNSVPVEALSLAA